ncbi:MAG: hypothetical protein LBT74_08845 [Acidobacteriota bacterium]|nr:hypothetical protein [Acidobacteriota bacterium]
MKKFLVSVIALALATIFAACGGSKAGGAKGGAKDVEVAVVTSNKTDEWPGGVYDAYGIPEYKAGKVVFANPGDRQGGVYIQTTREDLLGYVGQLQGKGFRVKDAYLEALAGKRWENFEVFFPRPGGQYALSLGFSFDDGGKGYSEMFYDEGSGEERWIDFNLSLHLVRHGAPAGVKKADLLTELGIPDSATIPGDAAMIDELETAGNLATGGQVAYSFEYAFDYELTLDAQKAYADRLIDACAAASDDGKLILSGFGGGEAVSAAVAKEKAATTWAYAHKGRRCVIHVTGEGGYGGKIDVRAQAAQ